MLRTNMAAFISYVTNIPTNMSAGTNSTGFATAQACDAYVFYMKDIGRLGRDSTNIAGKLPAITLCVSQKEATEWQRSAEMVAVF